MDDVYPANGDGVLVGDEASMTWFWALTLALFAALIVGWVLIFVVYSTLCVRGCPSGPQGIPGLQGPTGKRGVPGGQGQAGAASVVVGPTGGPGTTGFTGATGESGPGSTITGPKGDQTGPPGDTPTGAMELGVIFTNSGGPHPPTADFPPTGAIYNNIWDDYEEFKVQCAINCMQTTSNPQPCTLSFIKIGANVTMGILPVVNQILFKAGPTDNTQSAILRVNSQVLAQLTRFFFTSPPHPVIDPLGTWNAGFNIEVFQRGLIRRMPGLMQINARVEAVAITISACVLTGDTGGTGGTVPPNIVEYGGFNPNNGFFGMIDAIYGTWNLLGGSV